MSDMIDYSKLTDFHVHSTASDGTLRPAEVAAWAGKNKMAAIALTDHDTVAGVREFMEEGQKYPDTEFIPGVELSSLYGSKEMHFVGLFVDIENEDFLVYLEQMRQWRLQRNIQIARKFASLGYPIDADEVDYVHNDSVGRVHFAAYLVKHYGFESVQAVFDRYLRKNCSAFVPRTLPMPSDAIAIIRKAGGIAVWAHPIYREKKNNSNFLRRMVKKMKGYGLDGIECYYSMFGSAETEMLLNAAENNELLVSGGSDFHGENRPEVEIAVGGGKMRIPAELTAKMHEYLKRRGEVIYA